MRIACLWFEKPAPTSELAELFLRFSPQICLRQDRAIFVEIGRCRHLYSEDSFSLRALSLLRRYHQTARLHVGNDVTDSLALALYQKEDVDQLPLEALVEFADPFKRDEILRKEVHQLIFSFQDLGVRKLGAFKTVPVGELVSRFGVLGRFVHQRAHLKSFIDWPLWKPAEVIVEKKEFPYFEFYGELDPLLFEMKTQLDRIFARLFARRLRATKLELQVRCEKISTHPDFLRVLVFDFFAPQGSSQGTLRILKERLAREFERRPVRSPIEELQIKVLKAAPFEGGQKNIFNKDEEKFEQLYSVHNQLVEILGHDNVFQAQLTEDRRPEKSWRKNFDSPHEKEEISFDLTALIPPRPTYLCRIPVRIQISAGHIQIQDRRYKILHWDSQVEKISGAWYENPSSSLTNVYDRCYSEVEIEGHQRICVFQTPQRQFYIHGYYG